MLNIKEKGRPIATLKNKNKKKVIIYLDPESDRINTHMGTKEGSIRQIPRIDEREVNYIAGPSGSGKSTHASELMKAFSKLHPEKDIYIFSRTDIKNDPAFKGMNLKQVSIDESLLEDPIDIETEINDGCMILFDDCNTIQDEKLKKYIDSLMKDILEVGRKLNIWIIITNHLVIPDERKMARAVLNEMQSLTVFPKSGATQQISYALQKYFGLNKKQIQQILELPSRWVTIYKHYPMYVMYDKGIYLL